MRKYLAAMLVTTLAGMLWRNRLRILGRTDTSNALPITHITAPA